MWTRLLRSIQGMKKLLLLFGCVVLVASVSSARADLTLKVADKEPPKELGEGIRALLQPKAVQLLDGDKPAFEFWFAKELPLKSKPDSLAKALDTLEQTTILGAVSVGTATRDYRDDELPAGVYTVRFALQQQDGNHSGSSDYIYFAVLVPARLDTAPDSLTTYKALVKASAKGTTAEHPH